MVSGTESDCTSCPKGMFIARNDELILPSKANGTDGNVGFQTLAIKENFMRWDDAKACRPSGCAPGYENQKVGASMNGQQVLKSLAYADAEPQERWGSSKCTKCQKGRYSEKGGGDLCEDCPVGQYQDEEGQTSCKQIVCDNGQHYDSNDKTGTAQQRLNSGCTQCEPGKYNGFYHNSQVRL